MYRGSRSIAFVAIASSVSAVAACSLFVSLDGLQSSAASDAQPNGEASAGEAGNGCDAGFATCGSTCGTNVATDPNNCGACGHICGSENTSAPPTCASGKCVFECAPHFDNCDGDGTKGCETALSPDNPHQCGACTRDCLGAQCASYECASVVVVQEQPGFNVRSLAVDKAHVFWSAGFTDPGLDGGGCSQPEGGIFASNPDGGFIAEIAPLQQPGSIAIDDAGVYVQSDSCNSSINSIVRASKNSVCTTPPCTTTVVPAFSYVSNGQIAVDAFHIYWFDGTNNFLFAAPLDQSAAPTNIASDFKAYGQSMVTDTSGVLWTTPNYDPDPAPNAAILGLPPGGGGATGTVQAIAIMSSTPFGVASDGVSVFWARGDGTIAFAPRAGGTAVSLATGQSAPNSITVDDTAVYWASADNGGSITRIGKNGKCRSSAPACPEVLATGGLFTGISVDAVAVYWFDHTKIYRVAK